ncbi:dTDP-4-dehydrorhamnose 3,5-epimerase [Microvirga flocculans]|uniref:dTDP-4-dehydrorhamnose 3,5-epimerase n=1 Tax=Microvirga flocculans TaxID=217168 RepID=A0A7W6IIH0_9HYPH|nr:dTDP-4-dehydrorhamnose 3,5-epimerase [Microvirga flocculans]MBB4041500.1 dTDP-4-dehydrorhamnose 3,5-epimerase [Microvirga flocculans]
MVEVESTELSDVKIIRTKLFVDARGHFMETYNREAFAAAGIRDEFVQDNTSLSTAVGTIRGLHFQSAPFAQAKLVRVVRGRILDVAVDLRRSSPTYGQHVAVELTAENRLQLFIPVGFAHGFCTLEPNTEVAYKVTAHYSAAHDHGVAWNDQTLRIDWPVDPQRAILSDKDTRYPSLVELPDYFP